MKPVGFGIAEERPARTPRTPGAAGPKLSGKVRTGVCAPPPRAGEYRCAVVDPPWDQGKTGRRVCRPNQGTELDYGTLPAADILRARWSANGPGRSP